MQVADDVADAAGGAWAQVDCTLYQRFALPAEARRIFWSAAEFGHSGIATPKSLVPLPGVALRGGTSVTVRQRLVRQARRLRSWLSCARSYVGGGYPLRNLSSDRGAPFFIVGSGRSGTTLLRAMLTGHPGLDIPPESYVLPAVIRGFQDFSFLPWDFLVPWVIATYERHPEFDTWQTDLAAARIAALHIEPAQRTLRAILDEVYGAYTLRAGKGRCRWGDKTPLNTLHLPTIYAAFPDAQYVHVLRDGRAVAASYVCAGLYSSAVEAAMRWEVSVQAARKLGRRLPARQFLEIRYEDLVTVPRETMARVSAFLGVEMVDAMLEPRERAGSLGDVPRHEHHGGVFEPLTAAKIEQWKDSLSPGQLAEVEAAVGRTLKAAGYDIHAVLTGVRARKNRGGAVP